MEANPNQVTPALFQNMTEKLENLTVTRTRGSQGMSPGDLDVTVDCLESLVNIRSDGQNVTAMTTREAQSMMDTASALLSPNNMEAWETVLEVSLPLWSIESKIVVLKITFIIYFVIIYRRMKIQQCH